MAHLSELQIEKIKEHMLHEEAALKIKFKSMNTLFDKKKVLHAEVETYENLGWIADAPMKTKTPISKRKDHSRQFEDDIWCMFYNLGFRVLNSDEKLRIQWGDNPGEDKQIDVLAVGDDAIFVCRVVDMVYEIVFYHDVGRHIRYLILVLVLSL